MGKLGDLQDFQGRLVLQAHPALSLTEDAFYAFCQQNRDLRIERNAEGDLIIMAPAGFETGFRNNDLSAQLYSWAKRDGSGVAADSSTGYILPNGAERSPDASWIRRTRLADLSPEQKRKFLPLCPDFAVELMSPTDRLSLVQSKMIEYIENGLLLGWLLDPSSRTVYVYRPAAEVVVLENPRTVSGDPELPKFTLDLTDIWDPAL